jgi:proline iminopeptidase
VPVIGPLTVAIENATLRVSVEGNGPALLVVGSSIYYPRTFSAQIKSTCMLVCADLPHFVLREPEFQLDSISFELYAQCIERIRTAIGCEELVLMGHSHHGNIALEYAKRYPDKVSHLVLIGSPPVDIAKTIEAGKWYWRNHASEQRKAMLLSRRSGLSEEYLASLSPTEAYIAEYVADAPMYWYNPCYDAAWLWQDMTFDMEGIHAFRNLYREYELNGSSSTLQAPVLIVMGRQDYTVPHILWDAVLPRLENATLRVLEKSGHTPQLEEPEAFDELLLDWLKSKGKRIQ